MVSVVMAAADPTNFLGPRGTAGEHVGYFIGGVLIEFIERSVVFVPLLLVLGTAFYLFRRLRGTGGTFLQAVFDWRLMVVMVVFILLSGPL